MDRRSLIQKIHDLITFEARSCSMDPALVTPEYVFRMWGERVPLEEIEAAMAEGDRDK